MDRRAFFLASLGLPLAAATARGAPDVELIYVGGWDCPYCTEWKNQHKAEWLASAEHTKVKYVEIDVPHLREAYQARYWPGELGGVLAQVPSKSGTPRFLIVRDGKLIDNGFGGSAWPHTTRRLRELVG
jgi:hypothetical protein